MVFIENFIVLTDMISKILFPFDITLIQRDSDLLFSSHRLFARLIQLSKLPGKAGFFTGADRAYHYITHNTNIPFTKENGYPQIVCNFFAVFLQLGIVISKLSTSIASLNRDTMNELFILFCFLLVLIPILIGTQAFDQMIENYQEEEDQL